MDPMLAAARYNLANSGILGVDTEDLELQPGDVLVNGPNRDGYAPLLEAIAAKYQVVPEQVLPSEGTSGANFLAAAILSFTMASCSTALLITVSALFAPFRPPAELTLQVIHGEGPPRIS